MNLSEAVRWADSSIYKAALEDLPTTYYMASPISTRIAATGYVFSRTVLEFTLLTIHFRMLVYSQGKTAPGR